MKPIMTKCYCAFCRSRRGVYRKRHLSLVDALLSLLASFLLMLMIWQDLDPRAFIFFVFAMAFAEFFIVLRWRLSIICRRCGFDPVLYKNDPAQAAQRVKQHLARYSEDPMMMLRTPPKLPVVIKRKDPEAKL